MEDNENENSNPVYVTGESAPAAGVTAAAVPVAAVADTPAVTTTSPEKHVIGVIERLAQKLEDEGVELEADLRQDVEKAIKFVGDHFGAVHEIANFAWGTDERPTFVHRVVDEIKSIAKRVIGD